MNKTIEDAIRTHAVAEYPRECCGLIVIKNGRRKYLPCRNIAEGTEHFAIDPEDYMHAEDRGQIVAIVHSHPNMTPEPSKADLASCEDTGLPWIILSWPSNVFKEFTPTGFRAPLVGREYNHGAVDCYSIVRDYYRDALSLELPNYYRTDEWWLKGQNLYEEHFKENGFIEVNDEIQVHDTFLMKLCSPVINHAAIYVGDGMILQHCQHLLSSKDMYGGFWQKMTVKRVRHRSLV